MISAILPLLLLPAWMQEPAQDLDEVVRMAAIERAGLERRALFLEAWERAGADQQSRAARVLRLEREGARRASSTPSVRALTRAWRALTLDDEDPFAPPPLRELADSLDLRVLPGFFEGQESGKPQPLTVRVSQLYLVNAETPVELTLTWKHSDGRTVHGRTEPIASRAFKGNGFIMYLRAPSVVPGAWTLEPKLEWEGESSVGVSISVLGIDHARELVEGADAQTVQDLELLRQYGIRPLFERSFLSTLGILPVEDETGWQGARPLPLDDPALAKLQLESASVWGLGIAETDSPRAILFLLPPDDERPETAFVGRLGSEWGRVARENEWWIITSRLPLVADDAPSVLKLAKVMGELHSEAKRVLVARGSALLSIQMARLRKPDWNVEHMVVSTVLGGSAPPRNLPSVSGLFLSSDAHKKSEEVVGAEGAPQWLFRRRTVPQIVTDLSLPGTIADWLE